MERMSTGPAGGRAVQDAKGMLTVALLGVVVAIVVNEFITENEGDLGGLESTILGFVVPIIVIAVLLKIMNYI